MNHLLFLARPFPPVETIAAVRTANIVKFLTAKGWKITVVTVNPAIAKPELVRWETYDIPDSVTVVYTDLRWRCLTGNSYQSFLNKKMPSVARFARLLARRRHIDNSVGWIKPVIRAGQQMSPGDVNVILATGRPYSAFVAACQLSHYLQAPFVMDYRDPWTISPHHPRLPQRIKHRESCLLSQAAGVCIVSPSWAAGMTSEFQLNQPIDIVSNGYDPRQADGVEPMHFPEPALVYTGILYPPKRVLTPALEALHRLSPPGNAIRMKLHYFGPDGDYVVNEARRCQAEALLVCHGKVERHQALAAVKGATASLVVTSIEESALVWDNGIVTGKIFEPLMLGTPIALIAPSGSDARQIVDASQAGAAFSGSEVAALSSFLNGLIQGQIRPSFCGREQYSWETIVQKLETTLLSAIESALARKY